MLVFKVVVLQPDNEETSFVLHFFTNKDRFGISSCQFEMVINVSIVERTTGVLDEWNVTSGTCCRIYAMVG